MGRILPEHFSMFKNIDHHFTHLLGKQPTPDNFTHIQEIVLHSRQSSALRVANHSLITDLKALIVIDTSQSRQ